MPRPRFSDWIITPTAIKIDPSGSINLTIDLIDTFYPQIMVTQTYANTAGTTGIGLTIYPGFVTDVNGTIQFANNGSVVTMVAPTPNSSSTTTRTAANLNAEQFPRYIQLAIVNNDAVNAVTVTIVGDR